MHTVTQYLIDHSDDSRAEDEDDGEGYLPPEVPEESLQSLINLCKYLLEDKSLIADPALHQAALAAFVSRAPIHDDAEHADGAAAAASPSPFKSMCQRLFGLLSRALGTLGGLDDAVSALRVMESLLAHAKSIKAAGALKWLEPLVSQCALSLLYKKWPAQTKFKLNTLGHVVRVLLSSAPDTPTACTNLVSGSVSSCSRLQRTELIAFRCSCSFPPRVAFSLFSPRADGSAGSDPAGLRRRSGQGRRPAGCRGGVRPIPQHVHAVNGTVVHHPAARADRRICAAACHQRLSRP